ncbi:MAG: phage terminase large subunit family protein [Roseinatronobacter sp.]
MADLLELRRAAMAALRPPPRMRLSTWTEQEMRLPSGVSAAPGPVRLWKPQAGIADAIGDPAIPRVSVVKGVRAGYSTLLVAAIASYAKNDPAPVIALLPTENDCRNFVVRTLEPIAEVTPALAGLFRDDSIAGRNTILQKRFPGGSFLCTPARSPGNLRAHTAKILIVDECDAMEITAEGNPILLAEKRTLSYADRKIVVGSTPTTSETSLIMRAYRDSDQRVFEVPCPECEDRSQIIWKDIQWPEGKPEEAAWCCPSCGCVIPETQKPAMVAAGEWRVTRPEVHGHAGFKYSALLSLMQNASWGNLAREFLAAKQNPDDLRVFVNTILAETWDDSAGDVLDEDGLRGRVEPFGLAAIPREVLVSTCGIDMQDDRAEWVIVGHSETETFILANGVIWGRYDSSDLWLEVDDLLKSRWPHPAGGTIGVDSALIDSGDGEHQPAVYAFTRPRFARRVAASKGQAGFSRPPLQRSQAKGISLFIVGADAVKNSLFNRLGGGNSIRFSAELEARYFEELVSERRIVRYSRGMPIRAFERIPGRRAECLDATVYAIAARGLVNISLERRQAELASAAAPRKAPTVIRSKWLDG